MRRELEPEKEEDGAAAHPLGGEEETERDGEAVRRAAAVARFERVAASMARILDPKPVLDLEDGVTLGDERALEELYAAARGDEEGQRVSGLECMKKLNRALAALRPALAVGLDPSLRAQRETYEQLADRVGELRHHLTQRIGVEAVVFTGGGFEEAEAEDQDESEDGEEAAREEAVVRAKQALSMFTDQLALAAGRRRKRAAIAALADAARAVLEEGADPTALHEQVAVVLADPEAAATELASADAEELAAAIDAVRGAYGGRPEDTDALDAAARILESAARAGAP